MFAIPENFIGGKVSLCFGVYPTPQGAMVLNIEAEMVEDLGDSILVHFPGKDGSVTESIVPKDKLSMVGRESSILKPSFGESLAIGGLGKKGDA